MKKFLNTKNIVITGLLLALEIILQIIGNYLQIGIVNINLSLVPVVLAGILCGPFSAAIIGFFNGIIVLFSPSTLAVFMPISPVGTVVVCLLKCTLAGVLAALVFALFQKKLPLVGLILASLIVPIVNTGLFVAGSFIFFQDFLKAGVNETFPNVGAFLIFGVIGWNFIFEVAFTLILSAMIGAILLKREEFLK